MKLMLDTHVLVWWVADDVQLSARHRATIDAAEADGIAASAFSIWEVAMLAEKGRVDLGGPTLSWLDRVRAIPSLHLLPAEPEILVASVALPDAFHSDPMDRIIVATARAYGFTLLTCDLKILAYSHVRSIGPY